MTAAADDRTYYFVSDLHVGGDESLRDVAFEAEFLSFLADLRGESNAELIVNGDAFGLWEFTELEGMDKFDALVDDYPELFAALRETGETVPITLIPGNHDYELAAYPAYVDRLADYNVRLEPEVAITRAVGDRTIWIEHGMQHDPGNAIPEFGNPYANPPGYFVNRYVTSRAGSLSGRGRYDWLKDIQSVTPMERIPEWMVSNYFYREMSPLLRYAALPFLVMFNLSVWFLAVFLLDVTGIWSAPWAAFTAATAALGVVGTAIDVIVGVNLAVFVLLTVLSVPLYVYLRDVRKTLERFGLVARMDARVDREADERYLAAARDTFDAHPDVAVYVYGHTHRPSVREVDGRVVVNTGTWLKRLRPASTLLGVLPPVFYPSFRLNYVRISGAEEGVVVDYVPIGKPDPEGLTLVERLLSRRPPPEPPIPARTVVPDGRVAAESTPPATDD